MWQCALPNRGSDAHDNGMSGLVQVTGTHFGGKVHFGCFWSRSDFLTFVGSTVIFGLTHVSTSDPEHGDRVRLASHWEKPPCTRTPELPSYHLCEERLREEDCQEASIPLSASMASCVPSDVFRIDSEVCIMWKPRTEIKNKTINEDGQKNEGKRRTSQENSTRKTRTISAGAATRQSDR